MEQMSLSPWGRAMTPVSEHPASQVEALRLRKVNESHHALTLTPLANAPHARAIIQCSSLYTASGN